MSRYTFHFCSGNIFGVEKSLATWQRAQQGLTLVPKSFDGSDHKTKNEVLVNCNLLTFLLSSERTQVDTAKSSQTSTDRLTDKTDRLK